MPVKLPIPPPTDPVSAEAGPCLAHLNDGNYIESSVNPTRWLLELLRMRTRGTCTLRAAIYLTYYIADKVGSGPKAYFFAKLAIMECLGQVDIGAMTPDCLRKMHDDTYNLALGRTTAYTDDGIARRAILARRAATTNSCGADLLPFMDYYTRLAEALVGSVLPQ